MKIHLNYFKYKFIRFRLFLICFVFSGLLFSAFGTNFYIDNNANGSNNGTSWANAWESFSSINWSGIGTDAIIDTIYISGGSSSQTYYETLNVPQGKHHFVITKGISAGHNGEVIIDCQTSRNGINVDANGGSVTYVTISYITVQNPSTYGIYADGENSGGLRNFTIDHCKVLNFRRAGIFIEGNNNEVNNFNITVSNCYVNDLDGYTSQSDCIYLQYLDSIRVTRCNLVLDNPADPGGSDWHSDDIQTF